MVQVEGTSSSVSNGVEVRERINEGNHDEKRKENRLSKQVEIYDFHFY